MMTTEISTHELFNFAKKCNCCKRHQLNKPCSLYGGWAPIPQKSTCGIKKLTCHCRCRQVSRDLARKDTSVLQIYYCKNTTEFFVRLPVEEVPNPQEFVFLTNATRNVDIFKLDMKYYDNICEHLGKDCDTEWIYYEIRKKIGDAWGGHSLACKLDKKWPMD